MHRYMYPVYQMFALSVVPKAGYQLSKFVRRIWEVLLSDLKLGYDCFLLYLL
jgi:hypothetical protein